MKTKTPSLIILLALTLALPACNGGTQPATVTPTVAVPATATMTPATEVVPTLPPEPTAETPRPEESLIIVSPGPQSQIASPVIITGISDPAFENNLGVQILDQNGGVVGTGYGTIRAELGDRGQFDGVIDFTPPAEPQPGTLVVFDASARDGHIITLSSVPVILLPAGSTDVIETGPAAGQPEQITIDAPSTGATISGGIAHVRGFSVPFFEQTINVLVLDVNGVTVGNTTLHIQSEVGQAGTYEGDVSYAVSSAQPGTIQVYATSPRDGSIVHLSSVDVTLEP
jgi:Immunoglobulin-like domain of bacterial spore germination